jgi:hypothetical protein
MATFFELRWNEEDDRVDETVEIDEYDPRDIAEELAEADDDLGE